MRCWTGSGSRCGRQPDLLLNHIIYDIIRYDCGGQQCTGQCASIEKRCFVQAFGRYVAWRNHLCRLCAYHSGYEDVLKRPGILGQGNMISPAMVDTLLDGLCARAQLTARVSGFALSRMIRRTTFLLNAR